VSHPNEVLVIEDEKEIRELMALHLLRQGYKVIECSSAEEGLRAAQNKSFDLIVLDWMLPSMSGIDFLGQVRGQNPTTSVLMVTARTEPEDIVLGLEKGADDYLTKPFEPSVFLARVKALLRRVELFNEKKKNDESVLQLMGLKVDLNTYDVTVNSEPVHFTPSEFKLLVVLLQSRGKVLTRDELIEEIQGEGVNVIGRTIDTHVFGMRKKLGAWSENIETIRGVGYRVKVEV